MQRTWDQISRLEEHLRQNIDIHQGEVTFRAKNQEGDKPIYAAFAMKPKDGETNRTRL